MFCIYCGSETEVVNSRPKQKIPAVWRRRRCNSCKSIFSSREKPDLSSSIKVQNSSGNLEPFSEDKLYLSIKDSLSHREAYQAQARQLTDTVIGKLLPCQSGILKTDEIIPAAYKIIRRFDRPAATYYKSHHRLENSN